MRLLPAVVFLLLLAACGSGQTERPAMNSHSAEEISADEPTPLFDQSANFTYREWEARDSTEVRGRLVRINPDIFRGDALAADRRLLFRLFEGEQYVGRITRMNRGYANVISITGRITGQEGAYFTLSTDSTQVLANIQLTDPAARYTVRYSSDVKSHVLVENDPAKENALEDHPPLVPPDTGNSGQNN